MALGSHNDEEFDWEAAVAEIDDACNKAMLHDTLQDDALPSFLNNVDDDSVQNPIHKTLELDKNKVGKKLDKAVRQTTLDKFLEVSEKDSEGHQTHQANSTTICGNDNVLYGMGGSDSSIDPAAAQTWTYPGNVPLRDYQFLIVKTALFSNTLVSLPTGLGKTLIAAVVMYNYFRWFPAGKIVFTAPSRPLVLQQIEACHNIVGIPQEWTIDMTGQMSPAQRLRFWQSKRVFFVTPQVLEKDIQSGSCPVKEFVCLVVDEAHRAMGNYAYCVVVREIMAVPVQLRILALTATPGSKQATIQMVIDNLQISTLEYRNENDPDVKKYIHNKNINLITVAMGKESMNVSNLLLEVITPVVQKLCSLGVFYSKDVTKLTPFEFLTARDKFRQSPPAFLAQLQYGEVEAYFGAAITLYHIYKLLFTHGVRPALEMLQQKLQQGSFARFIGRNETLWQVKAFMQQSVRHGAANPKIVKMKEIIIDHFYSKDAGSSRVIIFTNFRESVKDIMGSLATLGHTVKAMEFIGQSSGKASKGQSQRVQQDVLQKFRAGGYNTIVATSIGEEGLDIMEVDLVICFDANVSPLRMIQRMGRTGRKRDGRVVILASEGSELQGYLQKQAKGKALGKHMHNGGINSFNFHSSPRMVPHSYHPDVQFVEMSIEKFVHRTRKVKGDTASIHPDGDDLCESEMNILGRYFGSSTQGFWTPSVIAFPHYQLFPSRVYNVKHSFRTTEMLIDTLQSLKENKQSFIVPRNFLPNNEVETSSAVYLQHIPDGANETKFEGESVGGPVHPHTAPEHLHFHPCSPSALSKNAVANSQGILQEMDASGGQLWVKHKSTSSEVPMHGNIEVALQDTVSERTFQEVNASGVHICQGDEALRPHKSSSSEVPNTHFLSTQNKKLMSNVSSYSTTSLHCPLYGTGFVSVSPSGRVIISSPPTFPLLNKPLSYASFPSRNIPTKPSSGQPLSSPMMADLPEQIEVNESPSLSIEEKASWKALQFTTRLNLIMTIDSPEKVKASASDNNLVNMIDSVQQIKASVPPSCPRIKTSDAVDGEPQTPPCTSKLWGAPEEMVLATPDSCYSKSPYDFKENILLPVKTANASCSDFSPYLTALAEKGMVPESPILAFSKYNHVTTNSLQQRVSDSVNENSKSLSFRIVASLGEESITSLHKKGNTDNTVATGREVCTSPEDSKFSVPAHVFPSIFMKGNMNTLHDNAEQLNLECLKISESSAMKGQSTPLVNCKSSSCSEDWNLSSADTKSVKKPQKFKRLCKYKEHSEAQISACPSEVPPIRNKKLDITSGVVSWNPKHSKGNQHSKISVQDFIDEEAEVSSDEKVSTDEDDNNDSNDEVSESDSFIDDRLEFTTALPTQAEGGQLDMMAVYRRSLFTQSPAAFSPRAQFNSGKEISDNSEMTNASADNYAGSDVISMENKPSPCQMQDADIKNSSSLLGFENAEDKLIFDLDACSNKEEYSNRARKRKFSLQKVDPTEKLNELDNQTSTAVRNLREDFTMSAEKNAAREPIIRTFDDDIFEGLDLDALEAEAAEISRSRSNMNPVADDSCLRNIDTLDVITVEGNFSPSFDLGI